MTVSSFTALGLALLNHFTRLGLLSKLSERVTFVLIPPLVLIFLVLGTIFLGLATPTEGGAMGALGAFIMALARRKLSLSLLRQALDNTTRLSCFVLFILIGSTVFSFTFNAADGQKWVEHLFDKLPGGALGFLIVVNLLVFVLGMFIDFFEIAFIVIPLLAPVAEKILPGILPPGSDALIWFGVIIAINLQTSFLTPPFGFALFYLRSVAAKADYNDRVTNQRIPAVTTVQIYKGAIAFIVIQVVMVIAVIAWPHLVLDSLDKATVVNIDDVKIEMPMDPDAPAEGEGEAQEGEKAEGEEGEKSGEEAEAEDPAKALMEQMKKEAAARKK
jgi:tripartite ATP-independent transporter DctM subunit